MNTYLKWALILMLFSYVTFSAGYIYRTEVEKQELAREVKAREHRLVFPTKEERRKLFPAPSRWDGR